MDGSLDTSKWKGCMGKILKEQNSAGEEEWVLFFFSKDFTSITHVCKRTSEKNQDDTKKCKIIFHLEINSCILLVSIDLRCKDKIF